VIGVECTFCANSTSPTMEERHAAVVEEHAAAPKLGPPRLGRSLGPPEQVEGEGREGRGGAVDPRLRRCGGSSRPTIVGREGALTVGVEERHLLVSYASRSSGRGRGAPSSRRRRKQGTTVEGGKGPTAAGGPAGRVASSSPRRPGESE
jgi:hypothetical protein